MARMSHKFLSKLSRFEPPNELEKLAESKSTTEHDNKPESSVSQSPREPRALSPLTSIWDSDDDEERRQSITPTHHTAGSNGTSPIHKRMPKRSRPRGSESPVDVNSSNPTGEGSAKRQRRSEPTPSESTPVEVTEFPVPRAPNRRDAKKSAKARTGAGAMMCHQCRSTNKWAKMSCTNAPETGPRCKRRYCANCIVKRYPELVFDEASTTFVCPCCRDVCNCTVCTRKRGEEYVSTRNPGPKVDNYSSLAAGKAPGTLASTSTSAARLEKKAKPSRSSSKKSDPLTKTATMIEDSYGGVSGAYWGAVFSVRGERIGRGFIGESVSDIIVKEEAQKRIEEQQALALAQVQEVAAEEDDVEELESESDSNAFAAEPFSEDELVEETVDNEPSHTLPSPLSPLPNGIIGYGGHSPPPFGGHFCT